jgi:prepilin-type N-terminal cleavage/methylation domain-containing protein
MQKNGFTLIELLVSVAIFSVMMVLALGALLSLSVADRKAETLKSAVDNMTFALDSMTRAIRTGQNYDCGNQASIAAADCTAGSIANQNGANYFTFLASNNIQTYYRLDAAQDGTSLCGQTTLPYGCVERKLGSAGAWLPITSPDIVIQSANGFLFHTKGALTGDNVQPKVIITLSGTVPVSTTQNTSFYMQTTVTERIYDQ